MPSPISEHPTDDRIAALQERPLTVGDAAQIAEIAAEQEQREPADDHWTADEVVEELSSPTVDLPRASTGLFERNVLVGYQVVSALSDEGVFKAYPNGGVRTAWTRRGLGTRLLQRSEHHARGWHHRAAPGTAGELTLWAAQQRDSVAQLVRSQGYEVWRYFHRMRRDLRHAIDLPTAPQGFALRRYADGDAEPVRLARNDSFADHWGSVTSSPERWQAHMVGSEAFRPDLSFVATVRSGPGDADAATDTAVAGFVMTEEHSGETQARGYRSAHIALVGTVRDARGHGLASALLATQLQAAADAGYPYAELEVDSDSPTGAGRIYQRSGFEPTGMYAAWGKRL